MDYPAGSVKQDPETHAVAVRMRDDVFGVPAGAWGVMTVDRGGDYRTTEQVANWTDLHA